MRFSRFFTFHCTPPIAWWNVNFHIQIMQISKQFYGYLISPTLPDIFVGSLRLLMGSKNTWKNTQRHNAPCCSTMASPGRALHGVFGFGGHCPAGVELLMYWYCWWFRNPANQLRLVVYLIIYRVLYIPGGAGFFPSTVSWKLTTMIPQ